MTASSSLSPSGSHGLVAMLATELSAVGSRPFTLFVTQLSWPMGSNPDSSAGKPSPSQGSWPLSHCFSTVTTQQTRLVVLSQGMAHFPILTSCFLYAPKSKLSLSPALIWGPWILSGRWGASIKLTVWVCTPSQRAGPPHSPSPPGGREGGLAALASSP